LNRHHSSAQIVAKIEKPQALDALDAIIRETDALMVARGDLGVEIDVYRVPVVQKEIIARCREACVPVITATQMLESMRSSRIPTRAEATDVANAILDGTDAVMLSAETAMGMYPVDAVAMMSRIAREAEMLPSRSEQIRCTPSVTTGQNSPHALTEELVQAASRLADEIDARLVIVATRSGTTAKLLSNTRSRTPTLGVSDSDSTVRRMCLYWGVTPIRASHFEDSGELLQHVLTWARSRHILSSGDRIVLVANAHWTTTGHNMIVVHEIS
jgi:pyruvate kinase